MADDNLFLTQLKELGTLIDDAGLEPDPERTDWLRQRVYIEPIVASADSLFRQAESMPASDERSHLAELLAELAALLHASGDTARARTSLDRARALGAPSMLPLFEAASRDLDGFTQLARAHFLRRHDRGNEAVAVARKLVKRVKPATEPTIREAAQAIAGREPLKSAPALFRLNGCGVGMYGQRDHAADGSYVATHCISLLWVPVIPLAAYRVRREGNHYWFQWKEPLSGFARTARAVILAAMAVTAVGGGGAAYLDSPGYKAGRELSAARDLEKAGKREAALAAYEKTLTNWGSQVEADTLRDAAVAIVRLDGASVKEPFTRDQMEAAQGVVQRFKNLPEGPRSGAATSLVVAELEKWTGQLGGSDATAVQAQLRLLDLAVEVGGTEDVRRLEPRRLDLRRGLASSLAGEWPLLSLAHYAELGDDRVALDGAAKVIATIADQPSLLRFAKPDIESWLQHASTKADLKSAADQARAHLDTAIAQGKDAPRSEALEKGEVPSLTKVLGRFPHDQEVAAALAAIDRGQGHADAAKKRLTALGAPGWTLGVVQRLLGMMAFDAGKLDEADLILSRWIDAWLPQFQQAAAEYDRDSERFKRKLLAEAKEGNLPKDVLAKLDAAPKGKQGEVFWEFAESRMASDEHLGRLKAAYLRTGEVVPAAITLGLVKLQRASATSGAARKALLDEAEHLFLSIRQEASGQIRFHLGLGQVSYRLGKTEAGEQEFKEVLDKGSDEEKLELVTIYRDLGVIVKARPIAEKLLDSSNGEVKNSAADLLSLMAVSFEEREKWLNRGDPSSRVIQTALRGVRAQRLFSEGNLVEADKLEAQMAADYEKGAAHSGVSANNAAIAYRTRYECTSDPAHLDHAARLLESALQLEPDSGLITSNLADLYEQRAAIDILASRIKLAAIKPELSDVTDVLETFLTSKDGDALRVSLRGQPAFRRALELSRREQVLAPESTDPWQRELRLQSLINDDEAIKAVGARLDGVARLDTARSEESWAWWMSGKEDERIKTQLDAAVRRAERGVAEAVKSGDGPTQAAALLILSTQHSRRLSTFGDLKDAALVEEELRKADAAWPALGVKGTLGWSLAMHGFIVAAGSNKDLAEIYQKNHRSSSVTEMLAMVLAHPQKDAMLAVLRKEPLLSQSLPLIRDGVQGRPDVSEWVLGEAMADSALQSACAAAFTRPQVTVVTLAHARLSPSRSHVLADIVKAHSAH